MHFKIAQILNEEDRLELLDFYNTNRERTKEYHQDYNLFHVRELHGGITELSAVKKLLDWTREDNPEHNLRPVAHYFVEYGKGGFARIHHDNGTFRTIVSIIETKDLVGGDTVFMTKYERRSRVASHIANRHSREKDKPPYNKDIVPKVARVNDGESLIYGADVRHGVTEVESGHRLVLVTWYCKEGDKFAHPKQPHPRNKD